MILLLRALTRLLGVLWAIALALLGLGIALYCLDGLISLGSARPDRLLKLETVSHHVGRWLDQLAHPGATAWLALLCGLGAMFLGLLLLLGLGFPRRSREVVVEEDAAGQLSARPRALSDMARALAERGDGVTAVRRPRVKTGRSGKHGRLRLAVTRSRTADADDVERSLTERLVPVTEPFGLRLRVHMRLPERGERVQ